MWNIWITHFFDADKIKSAIWVYSLCVRVLYPFLSWIFLTISGGNCENNPIVVIDLVRSWVMINLIKVSLFLGLSFLPFDCFCYTFFGRWWRLFLGCAPSKERKRGSKKEKRFFWELSSGSKSVFIYVYNFNF